MSDGHQTTEAHGQPYGQDEWFKHDPSEPEHMKAHGEIKGTVIGSFLIVVIVLVALMSAALMNYFSRGIAQESKSKKEARPQVTAEYRASVQGWDEALTTAGAAVVEIAGERIGGQRVPISQAMDDVVGEYGRRGSGR